MQQKNEDSSENFPAGSGRNERGLSHRKQSPGSSPEIQVFFIENPSQNSTYNDTGPVGDTEKEGGTGRGAASRVMTAPLQRAELVRGGGAHDMRKQQRKRGKEPCQA